MTHYNELKVVWSQLTDTYQRINSTTSPAERSRLKALAEMLRVEYRSLSFNYR